MPGAHGTTRLTVASAALLAAATRLAVAAGADVVRGVNLGGWLVLERYIKPSLMVDGFGPEVFPNASSDGFPVDQWTFSELLNTLGPDAARERLEPHWDTWFTEVRVASRRAGSARARRAHAGARVAPRGRVRAGRGVGARALTSDSFGGVGGSSSRGSLASLQRQDHRTNTGSERLCARKHTIATRGGDDRACRRDGLLSS